jgi:hypothetical protein
VIQIKRIARSLRYALRDAGKTRVSDYEILDAVNTALDALYAECAELGVHATQKTAVLDLTEGRALLPFDYASIVAAWAGPEASDETILTPATSDYSSLKNMYFISGSGIHTDPGETQVFIQYHVVAPEIDDIEDTVDLPGSMELPVRLMAFAALKLDYEGLLALAQRYAGRIAESAFGELPDKPGLI